VAYPEMVCPEYILIFSTSYLSVLLLVRWGKKPDVPNYLFFQFTPFDPGFGHGSRLSGHNPGTNPGQSPVCAEPVRAIHILDHDFDLVASKAVFLGKDLPCAG
jgi:hypothetical protein